MSAAEAPHDGAAVCADLVRTHDFVRYASTLFLPAADRRALLSLYAFNVEIARVHEQVSQPLPGEMRLQWWTDMLSGVGHGGVEGNPIAAEVLQTIRDHDLPLPPLTHLIEEHEFDLYNDPMPSMAALEGYLDATVATLFWLAARVLAQPSEQIDRMARHAGLAFGMQQLIATFGRDASRRQLFLPLDVLQQHGCSQEEVFAGKPTSGIRTVIRQVALAAQAHLKAAFDLLADVPPEARRAFLPLAYVERALGKSVIDDDDPFLPASTSRFRILWTLWRASRRPKFGG